MLNFSNNYFELFGLPGQFHLDLTELATRYRDLQRVVHPDRYSNAGDQEKRLAMQGATLVNEAYDTLKDPLKRAQYMMQLNGVDANGENLTTSDGAFLMQQMQLREALEEVKDEEDPLSAVADLLDTITKAINAQIARLAVLLESNSPHDMDQARECIYKMQFLNKLHAEAEALEAELEDMI